MKRFNIIFSLILIAGFTCSDLLLASKGKRKARKEPVEEVEEPVEVEEGEGFDEKAQDSITEASIALMRKLDTRDQAGNNPLHLAVGKRSAKEVKFLLEACPYQISAKNNRKQTPLDLAMSLKTSKVVRRLLQERFNLIHGKDGEGNTNLHHAARNGDLKRVDMLIRYGAQIYARNKNGKFPRDLAANVEVWELLKRHHDLLNCGDDFKCIQAALKAGAHVNICDPDEWTPLHWAAYKGSEPVVQLLLDRGACTNVQNIRGDTSLYLATQQSRKDIVKLLLARRALVNIPDNNGYIPLHVATFFVDCAEVVQLLLAADADQSLKDRFGRTALMMAQQYERSSIVALLQG